MGQGILNVSTLHEPRPAPRPHTASHLVKLDPPGQDEGVRCPLSTAPVCGDSVLPAQGQKDPNGLQGGKGDEEVKGQRGAWVLEPGALLGVLLLTCFPGSPTVPWGPLGPGKPRSPWKEEGRGTSETHCGREQDGAVLPSERPSALTTGALRLSLKGGGQGFLVQPLQQEDMWPL